MSETRNEQDARAFFDKGIVSSGLPEKVVINRSGAIVVSLDTTNISPWLGGYMLRMFEILAVK